MDVIRSLFALEGKKAIITGASRGIGEELARTYHALGVEVALLARGEKTRALAQELSASGPAAYGFCVDLIDRAKRREAAERALDALGGVDILVNNAGIAPEYPAVVYPLEAWDACMELNLTAAFDMCRICGPTLLAQGYGKVINTCSLHTYMGKRCIEAYTASKGGLGLLTKSLAHEWAPHGVNVNGIAPGFIETEISSELRHNAPEYQKTLDRLPAGHWGTPADLMGAFLFLSSHASDYVQGHILAVDGGILAI
nr:SDR family oxidoreductase [Maliibacterium massiliense]